MPRRLVVLGTVLAVFVTFLLPGSAHAAARSARLCAPVPAAGHATCFAVKNLTVSAGPTAPGRAGPPGLTPANLRSAYRLPGLSAPAGAGQTIAIVDAYGYPTAAADLAVYRAQYGLPACSVATGCLRIVDQSGGTALPRFDLGWSQETALDLDMASAVCPRCRLLLVQARTNGFADLGAAVDRAVLLGATVVSNSYGGADGTDASYGANYRHPGVAITASTGDFGYGVSYPASSPYVTAVGGTSLAPSTDARGWTESAWSSGGSGCSTRNPALPAASGVGTGCAGRALADLSAVADPDTGVAVYARLTKAGAGWQVYGGTSASAPIIAGMYALAAAPAATSNAYLYSHRSGLFDVTTGANGSCPVAQWCTARPGWDGPTGLGTPNGLSAFGVPAPAL